MKILHLATHLNRGGISNYIFLVGSELIKRGHQIFVVSNGGEMEDEFREKGFILKNLTIRTKSELSPKIYLALPRLIGFIKKEKIDLIHAHTRVTQVMSQWASWFAGIPFLSTAHGFYKRRLGRRIFPAWGTRIVAISDPVAAELEEVFRISHERIKVVYNGVDLEDLLRRYQSYDRSTVRMEFGLPTNAKVIGITARLVPDKGHEYLIRAVKRLGAELEDLNLLIVGDGRNREYLESLSKDLGISEHVRFTGNMRDISKPLKAMDVFALPAVWREGFGLSIAEAMACQKPIIATNIWALNTLIQNGINGLLIEPRNVDALVDAVRLVLTNREVSETMARAGQKTAQEKFSLDRMVNEITSVYEEIVRG